MRLIESVIAGKHILSSSNEVVRLTNEGIISAMSIVLCLLFLYLIYVRLNQRHSVGPLAT